MKRTYKAIYFVLLMLTSALAAPPDVYQAKITLLNAGDAPGTVSRERLATCLRLIAQDLRADPDSLPNIVVLHVTARDAEAAGMHETGVRHSTGATGRNGYYEFWIVGRPRSVDYAAGLYSIVENHAGGHRLPQDERLAIMSRAMRYLDATVSVSGE